MRRPKFTYFVDGAIYGFAIGIGFAVFENYEYIAGSSAALNTAIGRVISTNLIHATASAIIGIAFGLARFQHTTGRWPVGHPGICNRHGFTPWFQQSGHAGQ